LAVVAVLAACGGGGSSTSSSASSTPEGGGAEGGGSAEGGEAGGESGNSGVKVGLALTGTKNDHGFYQLEYEGFQEAEAEQGFEGTVLEGLASPAEELDAMKNLSLENELVIGGGAEYADAAETLASQFPEVQYAIVTGDIPKGIENVHGYTPRQGVPAYVGGAAAAAASENEHLGFIGGLEIPPTKAAEEGFQAGAELIKPGIELSTTVVGSFSDPAKGKEAAKAQVAAGADQIFSFLDAGTVGVEQAVSESGKTVGIQNPDGQRCDVFEDSFGATVLGLNYVVDRILSDFENETMPDGTKYWGVEDPKIQRFELCPKYEKDPKLAKVVKETTEKVNNEEVELPASI
jgi:basic membrane protein A